MRSRGSRQPVETAQIDRDMFCIEKHGDSRNDCRLLHLRVRRQGFSGIDGGLAGDMQVFDALSLSECNSIDVAE